MRLQRPVGSGSERGAVGYTSPMCGRYNVNDDPWLRALLGGLGIDSSLGTRINIAPTEPVAVVLEERGARLIREMRWWLVPSWAPAIDSRYSMFNAKCETLATRSAFRKLLQRRRCILPASSFIEWTASAGRRLPWLIRPEAGAIAFAGLWDVWTRGGTRLESCAILTTDAAPGLDRLHPRMPVMLRPAAIDAWLDVRAGTPDLAGMCRARLPQDFLVAPLSSTVNNAREKAESLLVPIGPAQRLAAPA